MIEIEDETIGNEPDFIQHKNLTPLSLTFLILYLRLGHFMRYETLHGIGYYELEYKYPWETCICMSVDFAHDRGA
jgi:hypothetical protein